MAGEIVTAGNVVVLPSDRDRPMTVTRVDPDSGMAELAWIHDGKLCIGQVPAAVLEYDEENN